MKKTRVWTDEQRRAAADRMNKARAVRMANLEAKKSATATEEVEETDEEFDARRQRERAERLASYNLTADDQGRLAKLAGIQSAVIASDPKAVEAVAQHRVEMATATLPPARIGSREVSLIVRTDGTMVSQYGPCTCGKAKREWHAVH